MTSACIALLAALPALVTASEAVDGDNLRLAGCNARIHGIDAPETYGTPEPGGREATAHLWSLVRGQPLRVRLVDVDRYGRPVVVAILPNGDDVACAQVAAGHAVDVPRYSGGAYEGCGR